MNKAKVFSAALLPLVLLLAACSDGEMTGQNPDGESSGITDSSQIPAVIENFGFALSDFDPATGFAGDLKIAGVRPPVIPDSDPNKAGLDPVNRYLMSLYGAEQPDGKDVQMSFYLPLGTKVLSLVTGTVRDLPKLYSNDFSVRVAPEGVACESQGRANVLFETEHVSNPVVKLGDKVTAGQVIAEVSDYSRSWKEIGLGVVEIGVFFKKPGNGSPWHACPMKFIDPRLKSGLLSSLHMA